MEQRFHIYDSEPALSRAAASALIASARDTISNRARFTLALAGGSTPKLMYSLLASEYRDAVDWSRVHFFWTDERFVPRGDPGSNYRMAYDALLEPLSLPPENIHAPDMGASDAHESAQHYQEAIRTFFDAELPRFDWVLLGMGEDGHVASLFPGSCALKETERIVTAIDESPKPPPVRLTVTMPLINAARQIHFLVSGSRKQDAFSKILTRENADLPAQGVRPNAGTVDWWVELEAARGAIGSLGRLDSDE